MISLTDSINFSSPLLKDFNSSAVFISTVPLVSVFIESNGQEYTAILAFKACFTSPNFKLKHQLDYLPCLPSTIRLKTKPFITDDFNIPDP